MEDIVVARFVPRNKVDGVVIQRRDQRTLEVRCSLAHRRGLIKGKVQEKRHPD